MIPAPAGASSPVWAPFSSAWLDPRVRGREIMAAQHHTPIVADRPPHGQSPLMAGRESFEDRTRNRLSNQTLRGSGAHLLSEQLPTDHRRSSHKAFYPSRPIQGVLITLVLSRITEQDKTRPYEHATA